MKKTLGLIILGLLIAACQPTGDQNFAQEQIAIDQAAARKAADKAERKQRFKQGSQSMDMPERRTERADTLAVKKPGPRRHGS